MIRLLYPLGFVLFTILVLVSMPWLVLGIGASVFEGFEAAEKIVNASPVYRVMARLDTR